MSALRLHDCETGLDRRELVASDAAIENFLFSCGDVEHPASWRLHERNGEWPGFVADDQFLAVRAGVLEPPLLGKRNNEGLAVALRRRGVGRVHQLATCRAEDRGQGVELFSLVESITRGLFRPAAPLPQPCCAPRPNLRTDRRPAAMPGLR
jgi:hypothetical protein